MYGIKNVINACVVLIIVHKRLYNMAKKKKKEEDIILINIYDKMIKIKYFI